jgi:hypothetical protein
MSSIARRVALAALAQGRQDVFMEVYAAGIAHGQALNPNSGGERE